MKITLPHHFRPRDYQLPFLSAWDSGVKRIVLVWHRRSGKDKTIFATIIKRMWERVGGYYYFAPTYKQGKKIIWDGIDRDGFKILDHIPPEVIKSKNDSELKIELINGSFLQVIGSDNIDSIMGTNPVGCVFTEYALQKQNAWNYIRPILAENGGWAIFVFTPRGMNHGWKILEQAKANKDWFWQVLTVEDTKAISDEILDQEQDQMPADLFAQEYYVKFLEGASSFFKRVDENIYKGTESVNNLSYYQLGVDLAKFQDFTVITPFDLTTFKVLRQERFNQIDYTFQKAKIEASYLRHLKGKVIIDSTGVGEPVYDDLWSQKINIEPFHFTEQSRKDLLVNLQLKLEQDKIKLPDDEGLLDELKSFKYYLSDVGRLKIGVDEGMHDDRVMSLALAVWNTPNYPIKKRMEEEKLLLKQFDAYRQPKTKYFSGIPRLYQ